MKLKLLLLFGLAIGLLACKKDEKTVNETFDVTGKTLQASGEFTSDEHSVSGTVKVYYSNEKKFLVFENFKTDSGPDLYVYLSPGLNADNHVNISKLDATSGNFYFSFDLSVDETTKNNVLIWCKDFSVLFGHAVLN